MRVGLTGGIASGKSAVSAVLRDLGAVIIDYDALARDAVAVGTPALAAIAERFGASVIGSDGSLDRPALGAVVFHDPEARRALEEITHPAIRALARQRDAAAGAEAVVVHDHPLLVEMGAAAACDQVVVVDVPVQVQVDRMVHERSMTEDEARARIAAQATREERRAAADVVIDNTGSLDDLRDHVAGLWATWQTA